MRRFFGTILIAAIGTMAIGVGVGLAADVEVAPAEPEAGETELTIEVTDFDPGTPIYAVPCEVPVDGGEIDVTTDDCDVASVATATTDAVGSATIVVEWSIPPEGIAVHVGDETRDNEATQILTPGVNDDDEDDTLEVAVLGTNVAQEDLADTGPLEVMVLVMVAAACIGLGLALRSVERLHTPT